MLLPGTNKSIVLMSGACNLLDASLFSGQHITSPKSLLANNPFHYTME
jgi:hypothetical protein